MTLCDVNIYIYAFMEESTYYKFYNNWLSKLLNSDTYFFYTEIILSSFVRIATNPKIFDSPSPLNKAFDFTKIIKDHHMSNSIMPGANHWKIFKELCKNTKAIGNDITDAYLAALAIEAGAEFITADKGFKKFNGLKLKLLKP